MSMLRERMAMLMEQAGMLEPWVGCFREEDLLEWVRLELGCVNVLDGWVEHGRIRTRAVALSPLLHVVSGNTPHAAFQSVFRGLLVGAFNRVKLPGAGLPEFERWVGGLPEGLSRMIEMRRDLPEEWLDSEGAVIFGDGATMAALRERLLAGVRRIEHGPKVSVAVVFEEGDGLLDRLAEDILRYDQQGCLSVQAVYFDGTEEEVLGFGDRLAEALGRHRAMHPRGVIPVSEAGRVRNARAVARFLVANGEGGRIWESEGSTEWTLVHRRAVELVPGPLHGFVTLHGWFGGGDVGAWGGEVEHLSTVSIHPFTEEHAERVGFLGSPRVCAVGESQRPTLFWHHDGVGALSSLVRWRDLG